MPPDSSSVEPRSSRFTEIKGFQPPYRWLSNFWPCRLEIDGLVYPTTEHAYPAHKTLVPEERQWFTTGTAGEAKRLGRRVTLRPDWNAVKLGVMGDLQRAKFKAGSSLAAQLMATYPLDIEETNTWGDTFWGVCRGKGENHLGKIIMAVRDELITKAERDEQVAISMNSNVY